VVTADQPALDQSLDVEIEAAAIRRTSYLDLDRRLNPLIQHGPGATGGEARRPSPWRRLALRLKRLLGGLYRDIVLYPDRRIDWSFTLLPALFREIRHHRPDMLLVSGPPFSYPGSFLLRVDDATAVNGATATLLAGRAITVSGHGNARVTVVRADTSTRDRAFVFGLPALAFLAGFVGTLLHYH
jgi:hypothetical protein